MSKTLEIIIPAYNAKDTIDKTLASISIQRFTSYFEVLIVNDNSDYDYSFYIDKYKKYFDIRELILDKNVGPGLAREEGIKNSKSDYIMFIDSDDYLYTPFSIQFAINTIKNKNADLLIGSFIYERDNKVLVKKKDPTWLHGKVYKRNFLEKYDIHFNDTRKNEDNGFNRLILLLEPKIVILDDIIYVYQENPNSITRKNNREYKFTGLEGYFYNMNWSIEKAKKRGASEEVIRNSLLVFLVSSYYYYIDLYDKYDVSYILKWVKEIWEKYKKYNYSKEEIDIALENNKNILESKHDFYITFDEYLERMKNYND